MPGDFDESLHPRDGGKFTSGGGGGGKGSSNKGKSSGPNPMTNPYSHAQAAKAQAVSKEKDRLDSVDRSLGKTPHPDNAKLAKSTVEASNRPTGGSKSTTPRQTTTQIHDANHPHLAGSTPGAAVQTWAKGYKGGGGPKTVTPNPMTNPLAHTQAARATQVSKEKDRLDSIDRSLGKTPHPDNAKNALKAVKALGKK